MSKFKSQIGGELYQHYFKTGVELVESKSDIRLGKKYLKFSLEISNDLNWTEHKESAQEMLDKVKNLE